MLSGDPLSLVTSVHPIRDGREGMVPTRDKIHSNLEGAFYIHLRSFHSRLLLKRI